jgi:hypothetical protein
MRVDCIFRNSLAGQCGCESCERPSNSSLTICPKILLIKGSCMPKKVLVALPPGLLEQIDFVAQVEHRNRSDLIREALRRYIETFKRTQGPRMSVSTVGPQKVALLTEE